MGGIGKSVLAAALARDRKIREAFPDGIVWLAFGPAPTTADLQRRLHKDLGGDGAFHSEQDGRVMLRDILKEKSVLLILDDVWRREDVDLFDVLGPRCRVIITTRDSGLINSLGAIRHGVDLVAESGAMDILSRDAGVNRQDLPAEAAQIIAECGHLPLALALCGGLLRQGFSWGSALKQLQRGRIDRVSAPPISFDSCRERFMLKTHSRNVLKSPIH